MNCRNNQRPMEPCRPYNTPQPPNLDYRCGIPLPTMPSTAIPPISPLQQGYQMFPNQNQNQAAGFRDREKFPIGMGYVPCQKWGETYSMEQGLQRGTLFPELDLPFMMGRCR